MKHLEDAVVRKDLRYALSLVEGTIHKIVHTHTHTPTHKSLLYGGLFHCNNMHGQIS